MLKTIRERWRPIVGAALAASVIAVGLGTTAAYAQPGEDATVEERLDYLECQVGHLRAGTDPAACDTPETTTTTPPTTTTQPPAPTTTTYQAEANPSSPWTFSANWMTGSIDRYTRTAGATATLQFTGTSVQVFGVKAPWHGIATVSVDGGPAVDVDEYAATRADGVLIWESAQLAQGPHTVVFTHTNRKNPAAAVETGGNPFSVDRAVVTSNGPPTTTTVPPTTTTTTTTPPPDPAGVLPITRSGQMLMRGNTEYRFAGLNMDTVFGCWSGENAAANEANLDRYFRELNPHSMTRVWAYANTPWEATLQRIVENAEQYDQYLMVTLADGNNNGSQCGSNKGSGYPADGGAVRTHAAAVAERFDDTNAIAVWEVCNECGLGAETRAWYTSVLGAIRAADPGAITTIGGATCYTDVYSLQTCQDTNAVPGNELVSIHEYDWNNGGISHWADETATVARNLSLPWFAGEWGFSSGGGRPGYTDAQAGTDLATEWNSYIRTVPCTGCRPAAGSLYWDFKFTYRYLDTVNFDEPMWNTARDFRHDWHGPA